MPLELRGELVHQLVRKKGGTWVTCAGRSMEPTIGLGDRVRVEAGGKERAGDVVLIEASPGFILHRVVFRVPGTGWLVHMGDSPACKRPGIAHTSRIVGRAALPRRLPRPRMIAAGVLRAAAAARALMRRARGHEA